MRVEYVCKVYYVVLQRESILQLKIEKEEINLFYMAKK